MRVRILLVVAVVLGSALGAQAAILDNFDQATDFDPAVWARDVPNAGLASITLDTGNDWAHFAATGNTDMWTVRNNAPILWTPTPTGPMYAETRVMMPTSQGGSVAGLTVYDNVDGAKPNFSFGLDHWSTGNRMVKLQGLGTNNPAISVPATGGEAWLRLELYPDAGAGGVDRYMAKYKLNLGDAWSNLATLDRDVANARMGMALKTAGGGRSSDFSYFASDAIGPPPPPPPTWSVDIQGAGSSSYGQENPPALMTGPDPIFGLGNVWNAFDVPGHALPPATNPTANLVDSEGNASPVNFTLLGTAAGFSNAPGGDPLFKDYAFDSAGNAGPEYTWEITGLTPGQPYDLILYGGVARVADFRVDVDADGDLSNNPVVRAPASSAYQVRGVVADPTGKILGNMGVGVGGEQNWSGFQLIEAPVVDGTLWSVDIQGTGSTLYGQSNPALPMTGVEPTYGLGNVWNEFNVPGHALPVQNDPSIALVDSEGNTTAVTFSMDGPTAGWGGSGGSGGKLDLIRDYLFVDAGNMGGVLSVDWTIGGLDPTHTYELFAYGGVGRDMALTVDLDGDGSLGNEIAQIVDGTGLLFGPITPDQFGDIIGTVANGTGDAEGNWAGFQLRDVTVAPIPEPSSFVLAALGLVGFALYVLRRRKRSS